MLLSYLVHRTLSRLLRVPRSRGFGVQSPWAYRFLREVLMAREGSDRQLPFAERLRRRCRHVWTIDASASPDEIDAILSTAQPPEVLLVSGIKRSRTARRFWRQLLCAPRIGVAFDCFDFGLLFFDRKLHKRVYRVNYRK